MSSRHPILRRPSSPTFVVVAVVVAAVVVAVVVAVFFASAAVSTANGQLLDFLAALIVTRKGRPGLCGFAVSGDRLCTLSLSGPDDDHQVPLWLGSLC